MQAFITESINVYPPLGGLIRGIARAYELLTSNDARKLYRAAADVALGLALLTAAALLWGMLMSFKAGRAFREHWPELCNRISRLLHDFRAWVDAIVEASQEPAIASPSISELIDPAGLLLDVPAEILDEAPSCPWQQASEAALLDELIEAATPKHRGRKRKTEAIA